MHKYVLKRLLMLIPVILGVTFVVFFILNLAPGDPAAIILGDQATAEALAMKREELGLNDPIFIRYFHYMRDLLHGSLGVSYKNSIPVWDQVIMRLPNTAILATAGILVALLIGIPIGIISAKKQYSLLDNVSMVFALIGVSMPNFWSGLLLVMLFSLTGYGIRLRADAEELDSAGVDAGIQLSGDGSTNDKIVYAGGYPSGLYFNRSCQR